MVSMSNFLEVVAFGVLAPPDFKFHVWFHVFDEFRKPLRINTTDEQGGE